MLSERERRTLASIERELVDSDPDLARLFAGSRPRRSRFTMPTFLLVTGVVLMVLGTLIVTAAVAITGLAFTLSALAVAYFRPGSRGWPSPA
jgi:hypothetical protein